MANEVVAYLQGLIGDFAEHDTPNYNRRSGTQLKVGLGRSLQASGILRAVEDDLERYGGGSRHKLSSAVRNSLLRMSKKKLAQGDYKGMTRRQVLDVENRKARDSNPYGSMHMTDKQWRDFHSDTVAAQKKHHYVIARPLLSYREQNADGKHCTYGQYKDGPRWRCIQNLNHKEGGGKDEDGDDIVVRRMREHGTSADGRTGPHPRPHPKRPVPRARRRDDDDDEVGGGDDDGEGGEETAPVESQNSRRKRIRRENTIKNLKSTVNYDARRKR